MNTLILINDTLYCVANLCCGLTSGFSELGYTILTCSVVVTSLTTIFLSGNVTKQFWNGVKWVLVPAIIGASNGVSSTITKDQLDKRKKDGNGGANNGGANNPGNNNPGNNNPGSGGGTGGATKS